MKMTRANLTGLVIAAYLTPYILMYLFGAYVELTFDFTQWSRDARVVNVLIGTIAGVVGAIFVVMVFADEIEP